MAELSQPDLPTLLSELLPRLRAYGESFRRGLSEKGKIKIKQHVAMPWRVIARIFILAVVVNYVWELAQAPLYVGLESYSAPVFWHCFIASLGDGIMVLLIYLAGSLAMRRLDWFEHPGVSSYALMLATGLFLAILVEWVGVHVLGRWQYTGRMPLVPGLRLGAVPIAQMIILPTVVFQIVASLGRRGY